MNIKIQNLGAIKEACINLNKRLTVFCGPNNTGKTYVSYIIYALTNESMSLPLLLDEKLLQQFLETGKFGLDLDIDKLYEFRENQLKLIRDSLDSIFGISEEKVKSYFSDFIISFLVEKDDFERKILAEEFSLMIPVNDLVVNVVKKATDLSVTVENVSEKKITGSYVDVIRYKLYTHICSLLAFYPITSSCIFPVERNSIYTFNKELSIQRNVLIDQMQELSSKKNYNPFDILFKRTTRYPMAVRDGLEIADDLINIQNRKSRYYSFADELEKELLHGKVSISKDGEVLFASEKAKTTRIPIHLTASIVKTLASLTFYLRYWAKENDLIIIDEPELNLHPDSQIVLARIFARLLNNGFRLLISTHSDYIIRELNNLIMLSEVRPEIAQKARELGQYREDEYISASEVSAYLFNYQKRGKVVVKSIEVSDAGFEVATIDEAISRLNAVSEELYYMIKYGE